MDRREFGALVAKWRLSRSDPNVPDEPLSVRRLATMVHIAHTTLSRVERGQRQLSWALIAELDWVLETGGALEHAARELDEPSGNWPQTVPNQLPPAPVVLGREQLIQDIEAAAHQPSQQASARVIVVTGPGGIGKTAVAVAAGHRLAGTQGAFWADMRGWHEAMGPRLAEDILRNWCSRLGATRTEIQGDLDELSGLWRDLASQRALVVVVDNAREDQVAPLVPASPDCTLIVTTRDRSLSVDGMVARFELAPLESHDATAVLAHYSGMPAHTVVPLASRCAGMPLALRVAGEDAAAHWTEQEIETMARDWDALDESSAVDRATAISYSRLSTEAARAWRLCAHIGDPPLEGAAAALGASHSDVRRWLNEATRAHLLDRQRDMSGWQYHDLHRSYALRVSNEIDSPEEIERVVYAALTWILHGFAHADEWFASRNDQPELVPSTVQAPRFSSYDEAFTWVETYWYVLVMAVQMALARGWTALAWQVVAINLHYAFLAKPWSTWDKAAALAQDKAQADSDYTGLAWMHMVRGSIAGDREAYDSAVTHLHSSLEYRRWLRHTRDVGWSALNTARWRFARGDSDDEIRPLIDEAIEAHTSIGMQAGATLGTAFRGLLAARAGDLGSAVDHLQSALEDIDQLGDPAIFSFVHTRLAEVLIQQAQLEQARGHAQYADDHAHAHGADWYRIDALVAIADTYSPEREPDQVRRALSMAIVIADKLGDPREDELRDRLTALPDDPD